MAIDAETEKRLRDFRFERQVKRAVSIVSSSLVICAAIILYMVFSGPRYDPILKMIGLRGISYELGGVYANCRASDGHMNPLCRERETQADREWKAIGKSGDSKFSLSGKP